MRNPAVELFGVTLARGSRPVLQDVDFSLAGCEFVGLLGGNGAGKTTLLHALLGLVPASAGKIRVLGEPPKRGNPAIGYMPQSRSMPAGLRLSGRAFIASASAGHRWGVPSTSAAGRRELDWALDLVDARALADQPLADLSGGQRQRLLLAQALIGRPQLLLLDEPLISLDPRNQRLVAELVRRIQQELQVTVLFSTHELNPLLGMLDRVLCVGGGKAIIGAVADVITAPVLSRLYDAPMDVVRVQGQIFVLALNETRTHSTQPHDEYAA